MRHDAFHYGKDIAQEMVEERCVMDEMHTCAEEYEQDGGDDYFFPCHIV
jgi:hypothetical protein